MGPHRLPLSDVLPLRLSHDDDLPDLTAYLRALTTRVQEVLADDGVRYDPGSLAAVHDLLDDEDVVRPQNYVDPVGGLSAR